MISMLLNDSSTKAERTLWQNLRQLKWGGQAKQRTTAGQLNRARTEPGYLSELINKRTEFAYNIVFIYAFYGQPNKP